MSAILLAPAMIGLGFDPVATHMLLLYFAVLAMVTPPIALAAHADAGIAEALGDRAGWVAFGLSVPVMLVPVMVLYRPELRIIAAAGRRPEPSSLHCLCPQAGSRTRMFQGSGSPGTDKPPGMSWANTSRCAGRGRCPGETVNAMGEALSIGLVFIL